jgi:hypothetical protein
MGNSNKPMIVVFSILFIVLLGEVGFLIYSNYFPSNNQAKNTGNNAVVSPEPKKDANLPDTGIVKDSQAIDQEVINNLTNINKEILITSELKNSYYGYVVNVDTSNGLMIRIKGSKNTNSFNYLPDELAKIEVLRAVTGADPVKSSINEIEAGQNIFIEEDLDLLQDLTNILVATRILIVPESVVIPSQ